MARLPTVSNNIAITQAPQSAVSGAAAANPYMQIADAFGAIGTKLEEQEVIKADTEGANAVYRDDAGTLKVDQRSNWSKAGQAYNRAANQAYTARLAGDIRTKGQTLFNDAKGDVDAFSNSWKGFSNGILKAAPKEARGAIQTMLDATGQQYQLGVSEQKRKRDISVFENDIKTEIKFLDDDMAALARGGGTATAAYKEKQDQMRSLYGELVGNPEFTVSQQQADMEMKRVESRHMSEAVLGGIDKTLKSGGVSAARKEADRILTDENLALSPAERRQYAGIANERINGFIAEQKVALKPVQDQSKQYQKMFEQGVGFDNPEIDATISTLARGGDVAGALELSQARNTAKTIASFKLADPESRVAALERGKKAAEGVNVKPTPNLSGVAFPGDQSSGNLSLDVIRKHEGFRSSPYWDVNAHRVGYGSDTVTLADGTVLTVTKDMKISRDDAERDLRRRVAEFQQGIRQDIGGEKWDSLGENVKAALTSVAYNYGSIGRGGANIADIVRTGDNQQIAAAIAGLSANKGRRQEEAALVLNGATPGQTATIDPEIIKEYRVGVTADAKELWPEIKQGITRGVPPTQEEFGLLSRQLAVIDDPQLKREVSTFMESEAAGAMIGALPPEQAASIISAMKGEGADGASIAQQQIIEAADRSTKATAEALKSDPVGFAVERNMVGPVAPLDLAANSETVGSAFASRQKAIDLLGARGMVGSNVSALRPEDNALITRTLASAPPSDQARLLGTMAANLSPTTYKATMADLATKSGSKSLAAAGALYQVNPQAAEGVLRGQALLKENPNFGPKNTDQNRAEIDEILPSRSFGNGLESSRQMLLDAATARYADLSNTAGDTSGELDAERMEQAVNEVTGGMLEWNGHQIIAPRYGMGQTDFETLMSNLPAGELTGASTADGHPITPQQVQDYGRLKAVGDGQYLLEFGSEDSPTYAMSAPVPGDSMVNRTGGGAFVLDLRSR